MTRFLIGTLIGAGLVTLSASAQYGPPPGEGRYYRNGDVFGRVRADLDRAESSSYSYGGDRHRFNKVRDKLAEFQRTGNPRELNDAIGDLQKVVNDNRMPYRDRDMLDADLSALRDFRARNGWR